MTTIRWCEEEGTGRAVYRIDSGVTKLNTPPFGSNEPVTVARAVVAVIDMTGRFMCSARSSVERDRDERATRPHRAEEVPVSAAVARAHMPDDGMRSACRQGASPPPPPRGPPANFALPYRRALRGRVDEPYP